MTLGLFIWTVHDIIGLVLLALGLLWVLGFFAIAGACRLRGWWHGR